MLVLTPLTLSLSSTFKTLPCSNHWMDTLEERNLGWRKGVREIKLT
jgi:hypothetical protein